MNLCGRWLSVLGIAVTLLWPQSAAIARAASGDSARFTSSELRALPVIGDFTLSQGKNPLDQSEESHARHESMPPGRTIPRIAPRYLLCATRTTGTPVAPVAPPVSRSLSRGPPAQV